MIKELQGSARKIGLPPASLQHIGPLRQTQTQIIRWEFLDGHWQEKVFTSLAEWTAQPVPADHSPVCLHVIGLVDVAWLEKVGEQYELHGLVMEDVLHTHQRPKLEHYETYTLLVLKALQPSDNSRFESEQVSLVMGNQLLITFWEQSPPWLDSLRQMLNKTPTIPEESRLQYLSYLIMDGIIDRYFVVLEQFGERMEHLENSLLHTPGPQQMRELHLLRRELLLFRKLVWPLREIFASLERNQLPAFPEHLSWYIRDVYDHTLRVIDTVEMYRDTLASFLDIYLSSVSNRMNEIMKVLTIISTLFIPLTFLAGVYGMNFKYMPELEMEWGYPTLLLVMACIAAGMLRYFHRRRWL